MSRANAKGRSITSRFVRLDHGMLESPAYRSLAPIDRALLNELAMIENGSNNGAIWLSVKDAAARVGVANLQSVSRAFHSLEAAGFIRLTKDAHFRVKASSTARARCWRLTWVSVPALSKAPTNEWREWQPEPQSPGRKRMDAGLRALKRFRKIQSEGKSPVYDSHTLEPQEAGGGSVAEYKSHTASAEKGENPPNLNICDSYTHTAAKGVRGHADPHTLADPIMTLACRALAA